MRYLLLIAAGLLWAAGSLRIDADDVAKDAPPAKDGAPLYHVVSLKFKEGTTPDQIKAVEQAFAALKAKVPGITSLHWGTNVSPEKHDKGFTHCFVLTFPGAKERDVYLVHDAHKAFVALAGPHIADVLVLDFEPR